MVKFPFDLSIGLALFLATTVSGEKRYRPLRFEVTGHSFRCYPANRQTELRDMSLFSKPEGIVENQHSSRAWS